jgi:hypothetical protein
LKSYYYANLFTGSSKPKLSVPFFWSADTFYVCHLAVSCKVEAMRCSAGANDFVQTMQVTLSFRNQIDSIIRFSPSICKAKKAVGMGAGDDIEVLQINIECKQFS